LLNQEECCSTTKLNASTYLAYLPNKGKDLDIIRLHQTLDKHLFNDNVLSRELTLNKLYNLLSNLPELLTASRSKVVKFNQPTGYAECYSRIELLTSYSKPPGLAMLDLKASKEPPSSTATSEDFVHQTNDTLLNHHANLTNMQQQLRVLTEALDTLSLAPNSHKADIADFSPLKNEINSLEVKVNESIRRFTTKIADCEVSISKVKNELSTRPPTPNSLAGSPPPIHNRTLSNPFFQKTETTGHARSQSTSSQKPTPPKQDPAPPKLVASKTTAPVIKQTKVAMSKDITIPKINDTTTITTVMNTNPDSFSQTKAPEPEDDSSDDSDTSEDVQNVPEVEPDSDACSIASTESTSTRPKDHSSVAKTNINNWLEYLDYKSGTFRDVRLKGQSKAKMSELLYRKYIKSPSDTKEFKNRILTAIETDMRERSKAPRSK